MNISRLKTALLSAKIELKTVIKNLKSSVVYVCAQHKWIAIIIISPIPDIAVNRATNLWNKLLDVYSTQSEPVDWIHQKMALRKWGVLQNVDMGTCTQLITQCFLFRNRVFYLCLAHCHSVRFTKPLPVHLLLNIKFPMNTIYKYSVIII